MTSYAQWPSVLMGTYQMISDGNMDNGQHKPCDESHSYPLYVKKSRYK